MSTKDATPAAPDESTSKAGAKRPARAKAPRRAAAGDVAPKATAAAIEAFAVDEAVEAARDSKLTAISDIVATLARHDTHSVAAVERNTSSRRGAPNSVSLAPRLHFRLGVIVIGSFVSGMQLGDSNARR
jgi:hypothetical protein